MEQPARQYDSGAPVPSTVPAAARTLVIDLEGGLLRSELLMEALFSSPGRMLARFGAGGRPGMAALTEILAKAEIDYAHLPYDADVLNQALAARARGEKIYLVADRFAHHAACIAAHLGFDGVVAPADLAAGDVPFDRAFVARIGARPSGRASLRTWAKALRVYQYAKNTLVFVPVITAHQLNLASLGSALLAFLAFSACASGAYLMNDLLDLAADRQHPTKRHRALAAGDLPISAALSAIPALWLFAVVAGLSISPLFLGVLGGYLATTIAYSLVLKRKMLVDIVTLAGLYTLRIVAGAVGVGVVLSEWLLIFSLFVFTSLALIKRFSEPQHARERRPCRSIQPRLSRHRPANHRRDGGGKRDERGDRVLALRFLDRGDAALQPSLDAVAAHSSAALLVRPGADDGAPPRDAG
ncbi:UbiA family prenyltransferase [Bradyrhizobium guangxiense]